MYPLRVLTKNLFPLATVAKVTIFHVPKNLTPLATLRKISSKLTFPISHCG